MFLRDCASRHASPAQLVAVVHLLEVMVQDNDSEEEELTAEDRRALRASDEYFRNGGQGIPFQENAAEFGFTVPPPPVRFPND